MVVTWIKCLTAFVQFGLDLPKYSLGFGLGGLGLGLGLVTCGLVSITVSMH